MLKRVMNGAVVAGLLALVVSPVVRADDDKKDVKKEGTERDRTMSTILERLEALEEAEAVEALSKPADGHEKKWYDSLKVGVGVRTSLRFTEDASGDPARFAAIGRGDDYSRNFDLDGGGELYISGSVNEMISGTLNFAFGGVDGQAVHVMDMIAEAKFSDEFNVWMGLLLPPTDWFNSDGPFFLNTWDYPFVSAYPAYFAGRDIGIVVWGDIGEEKKLKYSIGAFEGFDGSAAVGNPNDEDHFLYAARVQYNILDAEPGYYLSSTYYGEKNILAIGATVQAQKDAVGTYATSEDFMAYHVDVLYEQKAGPGVVTLEGAYYSYDYEDAAGTGTAYLVYAGYLYDEVIGYGKLQPHIRFQTFDDDASFTGTLPVATRTDVERTDIGINYVIEGHSARVSLVYSITSFDTEFPPTAPDSRDQVHMLVLGTQVMF